MLVAVPSGPAVRLFSVNAGGTNIALKTMPVVGAGAPQMPDLRAISGPSPGSRRRTDQADLLRGCHRRRLRSAISVCPSLRLWGLLSVASVAGRPSPGRAALNELSAPALTIHDVPNRGRRGRPYACHLPARPTAYEGTGAPRSFVTTSRLWGSAQGREATPGHKVRLATTRVEDRPGPSLTRSTCARLWNRRLIARIWSLRRARTGLQVRNFCEMDAGL